MEKVTKDELLEKLGDAAMSAEELEKISGGRNKEYDDCTSSNPDSAACKSLV